MTGSGFLTVRDIQVAVAREFGTSLIEMVSQRRFRAVARPRQVAMFLASRLTRHSLANIGRFFGGRDHTTVIHAINQVERLIADDDSFAAKVETLLEEFLSTEMHEVGDNPIVPEIALAA